MGSWRDRILNEFTPRVARLTLVADPDSLLLEEGVLEGIRERGFELIPFDDPIAFRYAYESQFRSRWDRGEETDLVVVLRSPSSHLDALPYDLLQAGRKLSFNLGDLFPNLSYPVVAALDRADLDVLFEAQASYTPGQLGDNATKEFVLRHVFGVAPELIRQPSDLLRVLLRLHYRGRRIPPILTDRLIEALGHNRLFKDWPLKRVIPDREAFFAFLQERWPIYLDSLLRRADGGAKEAAPHYGDLAVPILPFDHDDVRVYIDNLFREGWLKPVPHPHAVTLAETWAVSGIQVSPAENRRRRMEGLLDIVEKSIPTIEARHGEWLHFAYQWAKLVALEMEHGATLPEGCGDRLDALKSRIDALFIDWTLKHYASLINLPPAPPVMLHHIPRYLARQIADDRHTKIAFVLVDGLSLDQWIALREVLVESDPGLRFRESAVFAWVPTTTSVSRQAAFAGKPPIYFPESIHTTDKEPRLWTQFWVDQGLTQHEVGYAKGLGAGDLDEVNERLSWPRLRVVGLVVNKIDDIMHGMQLGAAGMHNQVRQWARHGFMREMVGLLHDRGFKVYLASDHGNVEAKGIGRPGEGAMAERRGERVRVYSDARLRARVKERFPGTVEWPTTGLPEDYLALIAPPRTAFVRAGETLVGHGGISVEELLVPFVEIDRKDR